jgi:hypothetical protein
MSTIRVGNGAGFWGDNLDAPRLLAEAGRLDYLTLEYLAELTMSILAGQKARDPSAGWVTDFEPVVRDLVPALRDQPGLRIVTNAGGIHPSGCARAVAAVLARGGLPDVRIAAVAGDDLLGRLDELIRSGESLSHLETDESIEAVRDRIVSANCYLGSAGIVDALGENARIVITGRVADASLTVGPAVHAFGWSWTDWNRLAAATVAGHLIECGAQCTGGMYSGWTPQLDLADVGYPVAEISDDGTLAISKPPGTGGRVSVDTVAEQLVYEIGDPAHYLTPDVDADFSHVRLAASGRDRVAVSGARGGPAPPSLKVSLAYRDGYTASATLVLCGPDACETARASGAIILERLKRAGVRLARTQVEVIGAGDTVAGVVSSEAGPWDVVLRVSAADPSREALERFAREFAPLVTAGPPGVTGYTGGRVQPRPVLAFWPTTVDRRRVRPAVTTKSAGDWLA